MITKGLKLKKFFFLTILTFIFSGCSLSSLNPFNSKPIYYIDSDNVDTYAKKQPNGGYTSKARHKATMRSYCVKGRVYNPTYVEVGDSMRGIASWYGTDFHGKQTSNGEYYNMYDMTVAHKTWPMDTMVKVTNLDNGKSVIARVNDRGPFVAGRIVDCSYAVGKKIGIAQRGTCNVRLDVVGFAGKVYQASSSKPKPKIRLTNFGVQIGAFAVMDNAKALKKKYESLICTTQSVKIKLGKISNGALHRVVVMGFGSKDEAQDFINTNGISGAFIVRD